jgi:catechol-2,3-dioxygenase
LISIYVHDQNKAERFYTQVVGLKAKTDAAYGHQGGLTKYATLEYRPLPVNQPDSEITPASARAWRRRP